MRWSCGFPSCPFQYAPATLINLNAWMRFVEGICGPRQKSMNFPVVEKETIGSVPFSFTGSHFKVWLVFFLRSIAYRLGIGFGSLVKSLHLNFPTFFFLFSRYS